MRHHEDYDTHIALCEAPSYPPLPYTAGVRVKQDRGGSWLSIGFAFVALLGAVAMVLHQVAA